MKSLEWMSAVTRGDTYNAIANHCGVPTSTITRQVARGTLSPEVTVSIARAYDTPVLPGLVACGLIDESEAALKDRMDLEEALATATDAQLVRAVLARLEGGPELHSMLTTPLDDKQIRQDYAEAGTADATQAVDDE